VKRKCLESARKEHFFSTEGRGGLCTWGERQEDKRKGKWESLSNSIPCERRKVEYKREKKQKKTYHLR